MMAMQFVGGFDLSALGVTPEAAHAVEPQLVRNNQTIPWHFVF